MGENMQSHWVSRFSSAIAVGGLLLASGCRQPPGRVIDDAQLQSKLSAKQCIARLNGDRDAAQVMMKKTDGLVFLGALVAAFGALASAFTKKKRVSAGITFAGAVCAAATPLLGDPTLLVDRRSRAATHWFTAEKADQQLAVLAVVASLPNGGKPDANKDQPSRKAMRDLIAFISDRLVDCTADDPPPEVGNRPTLLLVGDTQPLKALANFDARVAFTRAPDPQALEGLTGPDTAKWLKKFETAKFLSAVKEHDPQVHDAAVEAIAEARQGP